MNYEARISLRAQVLAVLLLGLLFPVFAQNNLYGPDTPEDIAWVRVLNAGTEEVSAWVGGEELTAAPFSATAYQPVEPGAGSIEVSGEPVELSPEVGQFLTLALLPSGPQVIIDPALRDVSRGLLGLMNLTARPALSLLTPEGDIVTSDVAPGTAEAVAISPAQTALVVAEGEDVIAEVEPALFDRAQAYTVVVLEGENGVTTLILTASAN